MNFFMRFQSISKICLYSSHTKFGLVCLFIKCTYHVVQKSIVILIDDLNSRSVDLANIKYKY